MHRQVAQQIMSVDVSELYSPERVAAVCKSYGLRPGQSMDIKNGFDFDLSADRKKDWNHVVNDKPSLVIGSPPCTYFSRLHELNKHMYRDSKVWMDKFEANLERAKRHVRCCIRIYSCQRQMGDTFCINIRGWQRAGCYLRWKSLRPRLMSSEFARTCVSLGW